MKKTVSLLLAVLLILSCCFTGGCQNKSKTVSVNGSSSTETVMKRLQAEFAGRSNTDIELTYTDSGTGIQAVLNGECEIGLSSRVLTPPEKSGGLSEYIFAYDAIAVIVNPENPIADLYMESLYKIFTGEIKNWDEIGGNSCEIITVGRESGSGTRDSFESLTGTNDICTYDCEKSSTNDVIEYVRQNVSSIGYVSVTADSDSVKTLKIKGVQPCTTTIKNRSYPLYRPFVLITSSNTELSASAQEFYDYIISSKATEAISGAGAVPAN